MFNSDITLNNGTADYTYSEINRYSGTNPKTIRSDAAQPLDAPNLFTISHEVAKSGRVSTAVFRDNVRIISSIDTCAVTPVEDTVRTMFKFQYNPKLDRSTIETELQGQLNELLSWLSEAGNIDKLLNKES